MKLKKVLTSKAYRQSYFCTRVNHCDYEVVCPHVLRYFDIANPLPSNIEVTVSTTPIKTKTAKAFYIRKTQAGEPRWGFTERADNILLHSAYNMTYIGLKLKSTKVQKLYLDIKRV